jgi:hypothetical protein
MTKAERASTREMPHLTVRDVRNVSPEEFCTVRQRMPYAVRSEPRSKHCSGTI